jgi:hypothetical protein
MTAPIAWTIEPKGDVSDGVVHADLISVDVARRVVTFDATQVYIGDSASVEAERDGTNAGANDYSYQRDTYTHVQRASVAPGAVVILQRAGTSDDSPAPSRDYGDGMFLSSLKDYKRRLPYRDPAYSEFWVVLQRGRVVALVELFRS